MGVATAALIVGGAVAAGSAISAGIQAKNAKKEKEKAQKKKNKYKRQLADIENNREPVINPYENVTNPFAHMGVATQAAEFQAEEADIALANTLDTLRATGAGAGGATALAQAALQSKRGISASIQKQEANNAKLAAQGETTKQGLEAAGKEFVFKTKDNRDREKMGRLASQENQQQNAQAYYSGVQTQAYGDMAMAVGEGAQAGMGVYTGGGGTFGE